MKPLLILAVFSSPLAAAIVNPVEDYLAKRSVLPEQNQALLAIPCDLDQDGIKDYLISNGEGLEEKFPFTYWDFYRGLPGGGYQKFEHAFDEDKGEQANISLVPYRTKLIRVPGTKLLGFSRTGQIRDSPVKRPFDDEMDDVGTLYVHRWVYYFSDGQVRKKHEIKTDDPEVYKTWFPNELERPIMKDFVAEAELLREGKPGRLAIFRPLDPAVKEEATTRPEAHRSSPQGAIPDLPWGWISAGAAAIAAGVLAVLLRGSRK